jgi:hypothetical protein
VRVDVIDSHGAVIGSCNAAGSLTCAAALALGPDESEMVHAEARASLPSGGYVTVATSAAVELTGMDADAFANFLLFAPPASLVPLVGEARALQALEVRTAMQSETYCVALGVRLPSNATFHASAPDATLLCVAGKARVLAYLIATVTITTALVIMTDAADIDAGTGPAPEPEPQPDPQPEPSVGPSPQPEPENALIVYRVWGGVSGPYGTSWTTLNPLWYEFASGAGSYRRDAGLPDFNTGTHLTTARVLDPNLLVVQFPARPYENPEIHYYVPGGLTEIEIPGGCSNPGITCVGTVALAPPWGILPMHLNGE